MGQVNCRKKQARCRGNKIANRNRRHCENSSKMQEKCRYNARNCCVSSYITKRSSEAPHLTELRLFIQLGNPAPVETKKKRQTNKTAGAGGGGRHSPNRPRPAPPKAGAQGPSLGYVQKKSALCIHANNSNRPMQGGILPLTNFQANRHLQNRLSYGIHVTVTFIVILERNHDIS